MSPQRSAGYALLLALSACAAPSALPLPDGSLDGIYAGHRTIDPSCGSQSQAIVFHVDGSEISVNSRHKHRRLVGTVAADGQIALHDLGDHRDIEGQLSGGTLSATELDEPSNKKNHKALDVYDPQGSACVWHFIAVRGPAAVAGPGEAPAAPDPSP